MVMALLRKKYQAQEVELRKENKGTPRHYKTIIYFTLPVLVLEKIFKETIFFARFEAVWACSWACPDRFVIF
jgi:hypothetical protein